MSNEIIFKPGKFKLAVQIALILFQIIFYSLLFSACKARLIECVETANNISSKPNINWWCEDNDIIIKVSEIDYNLQYYAEITLISGRRIAVQLGEHDENGRFRIPSNFGECTKLSIYTNLDLE